MTEVRERPPAASDQLVEQMGMWFASLGVPRAAGQMFGYLMACDPAEQSAGEISANTGMSPASVSSSARLLLQIAAIQQRHRVGDRKTYYCLRPDFWIEIARAKLQGFGQLAAMGRRIRQSGELRRTDGLDEMITFSDFWAQELPRLVERWGQYKERTREEP
jgi:hypothetical protein